MTSASDRPHEAFEGRLREVAAIAEAALAARLDDRQRDHEIARPARLMAAMRHGALGGGKRLRPFLVVETARLFGLDIAAAMPAATAIELIHCYSLVHDDLPAMDDDDLRRGQPTVHKAFDEATAILAGDGLLTLAFEVLAEPQSAPDPVLRAELVLALARASGLAGMVGGQMLDLEAEGRYAATPPEGKPWPGDVRRIQAMKTGALLAAAVEMGAILGRASLAQRMALAAYGQALGAAFQVADDVLDVESSAEALGKATAKDAEANKATLVAALGLEAARQERDRLAADAASALGRFGPEADMLRAAARFAAARTV
ncbi:MAG: polyprenyl synthetase family protein [Bosea sp.]|jgi:farnesyl diphosphate synthase|nr:polyprenyl synthetase family protein [Bosea sp. (in: a-proteobacteria)]